MGHTHYEISQDPEVDPRMTILGPRGPRGRRLHDRIPLDAQLDELYLSPIERTSTPGIGKDLSAQGMCILTSQAARLGQWVRLSLSLPNGQGALRCEGSVKWIKKDSLAFLLGIQFRGMNPVDKKRLNAYLKKSTGQDSLFVKILSFFKK